MSIFITGLCLFISGLGVGYIMGMSISQVVGIVLTSLITLIVSLSSALAGIKVNTSGGGSPQEKEPKHQRIDVNPIPLMALIVGIAFGCTFGIWVRTHQWLGDLNTGTHEQITSQPLDPMKSAGETGVSENDVSGRNKVASSKMHKQKPISKTNNDVRTGVLYSVTANECDELRSFPNESLLANIKQSVMDKDAITIAGKCPDAVCLRSLVNMLCKDK